MVGEIHGANGGDGAAALDSNDDNNRGEAIESANEEEADAVDISNSAAATATAPKPCASKRVAQKRPTTAHNPSTYTKKKKRVNCEKGAHIKVSQDSLFHILRSDKQKEDIHKCRKFDVW